MLLVFSIPDLTYILTRFSVGKNRLHTRKGGGLGREKTEGGCMEGKEGDYTDFM